MDVKTRIRNIRILKIMNENLEASKRLGLVDVSKNNLPQNKNTYPIREEGEKTK